MPLSPEIKQIAYKIDPKCWKSYSGKPKRFKQRMEVRRTASLEQAKREYDEDAREIQPINPEPMYINLTAERDALRVTITGYAPDGTPFESYSELFWSTIQDGLSRS